MDEIRMLFLILLLEGFITISVEILTIRQLQPFFGSSIVITSVVIGIFLLFLAIGYWRGGMRQSHFHEHLRKNFTYSLLWIGFGLSYSIIGVFYYVSVYYSHVPYLASLFLYLLIFLAPTVYWLGQTIPLTTNLFNQQKRISQISGHALFLSTIGSFLGALLTALVLFQYLGVAWTIVINCCLLFLLIISLQKETTMQFWQPVALLISLGFIFWINVHFEQAQFKAVNNYANYRVIEPAPFTRVLQINHSASSMLTGEKKAFPYIEFIRTLLFKQLNMHHKDILVVGAGGFTLTAAGSEENQVTYVDIDPDIKKIAEKYFLYEPIQGKFIAEDARRYLQEYHTQFDAIVSDAYSHQMNVPSALLTAEYFQALANHLKPNGILVVNIIANPFFKDDYAQIIFNSIHSVFSNCTIVPLAWDQPVTNIIYICPKVKANRRIYRDALNTATLDLFQSQYRLLQEQT